MVVVRLVLSVTTTPSRLRSPLSGPGVATSVSTALASAQHAGFVLGASLKLLIHIPIATVQGRPPHAQYPESIDDDDVPAWMRQFVVPHPADLGPILKLHGAVTAQSVAPEDLILYFDDDTAYPLAWVTALMQCGAAAACGSALDTALRPVAPGKSGASIAEGWAGVLVAKRTFMTPQWNALVDAASQDEEAYLADDVVISLYLQSVGAGIGVAGEADGTVNMAGTTQPPLASVAARVRDRPLCRRTLAAGSLDIGKQDDALSRTGKAHAERYRKVARRIRAGTLGALVVPPAPPPPLPPPTPWPATPSPVPLIVLIGQSNMAGRGGVHRVDGMKKWDGILPAALREDCDGVAAFMAFEAPPDWMPAGRKVDPPDASGGALLAWQPAREPLHARLEPPGKVAGVGPGVLVARQLAKIAPNGCVGVVPCAVGETDIEQWRHGGAMFEAAMERVHDARVAGMTELAACVFFQGENDCASPERASDWPHQVAGVASDVRHALDAPHLPFVAVIPSPDPTGPNGRCICAHIDVLRASAHTAAASSSGDVIWVDAFGLPLAADGVHLTTEAQAELSGTLAHAIAQAVQWTAEDVVT